MDTSQVDVSRSKDWNRNIRKVYSPLDNDVAQFRLLVVAAGIGEEPVEAWLELARFDEIANLNYETISYCWGDSQNVVGVRLNGQAITVPASAAAAVRRIRLPNRERVIWLDALCINQADLDEQAKQVAMMADIYTSSAGNLVYLGEPDASSERAIGNIQALIAEISEKTKNFTSVSNTPYDPARNSFGVLRAETHTDVDVPSLASFFSAPWFRLVTSAPTLSTSQN